MKAASRKTSVIRIVGLSLIMPVLLASNISVASTLTCNDYLFNYKPYFDEPIEKHEIMGSFGGYPATKPSDFEIEPPILLDDCQRLVDDLMDTGGIFDSGSGVDYGTGMVEAYFADVLMNLPKMIDNALSEIKDLTNQQIAILKGIKESLPEEYKMKPLIRFGQGHSFIIDGELKIAYTKLNVGEPIYINKELLYKKVDKSVIPLISYKIAIQILVHELGHHQGEKDHELLNEIGAAVAAAWKSEEDALTLKNSGFEEIQKDFYLPLHWGIGAQYYATTVANYTNPARGQSSMAITGSTASSYGNVFQCFNIPNKNYYSAYFSSLMAPWLGNYAYGGMVVQIFDKNNNLESYADGYTYWSAGKYNYFNNFVFGQSDYQLKRYRFYLSKNAQFICVGFYLRGYGTLWIDDVQVEFSTN